MAGILLTASVAWGPAAAQDGNAVPAFQSPVLTIDQDRLFSETRLGARSAAEVETESRALAAENRQIEAELLAEERELTERRSELPPDEFAALAGDFDAKVQRIRSEQDAKARALARMSEESRQDFFREIGDILLAITAERGALVVLDRRDVFLSSDRIDVTDEAIERINATVGDGTDDDTPDRP